MSRARSVAGRRTPRSNRPSVLALEGRTLLSGAPRIDAFAVPSLPGSPGAVVQGPDGNLWFGDGGGKVGRITPQGQVVEFPLPTPLGGVTPYLSSLTDGPDGAVWGVDFTNGRIDRVAQDGAVESFVVPGGFEDFPVSIVAGPDGNLWFSSGALTSPNPVILPGFIGRITPEGVITDVPLPPGGVSAEAMAAGPGGVWFTDPSAGRVGRVDATGQVVEFAAPTPAVEEFPTLAVGPDGDAYYAPQAGSASYLIKVSPSGVTTPIAVPIGLNNQPTVSGPTGVYPASNNLALVSGADGVDLVPVFLSGPDQIDRLNPDGTFTTMATLPGSQAPDGFTFVTLDSDGNLWFPGEYQGEISRVDLAPTPAPVTEPDPTLVAAGPAPVFLSSSSGPNENFALVTPAGQATSIVLAEYRRSSDVSDISATIDWGDGSAPAAGDLGPDPDHLPNYGPFGYGLVSGTHTYATAGSYTVTVSIEGTGPDGAPMTAQAVETVSAVDSSPVALPPLSPQAGALVAFRGSVAQFSTPTPHDASGSDFTATVDWGDGSASTTGTVTAIQPFYINTPSPVYFPGPVSGPAALFAVSGDHSYASVGTFLVKVILTDLFGHSSTVSSPIRVEPGALSIAPTSPIVATANLSPAAISDGEDTFNLGTLTDFQGTVAGRIDSVMVDWGDGSTPTVAFLSTASIFGNPADEPAVYSIQAPHDYVRAGDYTITLSAVDNQGDSVEATTTALVTDARFEVQPIFDDAVYPTGPATAGDPIPVMTLATFAETIAVATPSDFSATVDWGDGSAPTAETVEEGGNPGDGRLSVTGEHTYAEPGFYEVSVTVVGPDGSTAESSSAIQVTLSTVEGAGSSTPLAEVQGDASPKFLGTFHSSTNITAPSDFKATVAWGDGSPDQPAAIQPLYLGSVVQFGQFLPGVDTYLIAAGHAYATPGLYTLTITVVGTDGIPDVFIVHATVQAVPSTGSGTSGNPPMAINPPLPILDPTPPPIASPDPSPPSTTSTPITTTSTPTPDPIPPTAVTSPVSTAPAPMPISSPDLNPPSTPMPAPSMVPPPTIPPFVGPTFFLVWPTPFPSFLPTIVKHPRPVSPKPSRHPAPKPAAHPKVVKPAAHPKVVKPVVNHAEQPAPKAKPKPAPHVVAKPAHAATPKKHPAGPAKPTKSHR